MDEYQIIIVGGGPAGLAAALFALERKMKLLVVEAHSIGGQPKTLYPDKEIYDYLSYPAILARELSQKFEDHVRWAQAVITINAIKEIQKEGNRFLLTGIAQKLTAQAIILATGMGHFKPRTLGVSGEETLLGKGIYYQGIPEKLTGKRIVVVGGGDTALETAVAAAEKGGAVTIVHRGDNFRALEKTVEKAHALGIQMIYNSTVQSIIGDERVESVQVLKSSQSVSFLTTDYICICIGMEIDRTFLSSLGVKIENQAVVTDADMQTSMSGIFACGDVAIPAGKYKRISAAVGTAATAVNGVYHYLKNNSH